MTQGSPTFLFVKLALISFYASTSFIQPASSSESNLVATEPLLLGYERGLGCPSASASSPSDLSPLSAERKRLRSGWEHDSISERNPSDSAPIIPVAPHELSNSLKGISTTDKPAPPKHAFDLNVAPEMDEELSEQSPSGSTIDNSPNPRFHMSTGNVVHQMPNSGTSSEAFSRRLHSIPKPSGLGDRGAGTSKQRSGFNKGFSVVGLDEPKAEMKNFKRFPKYNVDLNTAIDIASPFESMIIELDWKIRSGAWQSIEQPGCTMGFYSSETEQDGIQTISWFRGHKQSASLLRQDLVSLTKWMLLSHIMLFIQYNIQQDEQRTRTHALFQWLYSELFKYTTHPPVLGKFPGKPSEYDLTYRPIQQKLIQYLNRVQPRPDNAYTVSLGIVGIWYKSFHQDFWDREFRSDEGFWRKMDTIIKNSDFTKMNSQSWEHLKLDNSNQKSLYKFRIMKIASLIPHENRPQSFPMWEQKRLETPTPSELRIQQRIEELDKRFPAPRSSFICRNLPAVLHTEIVRRYREKYNAAVAVRPSTLGGRSLPVNHITERVTSLLQNINYFHMKLSQILPVQSLEETKNWHEEFLRWFSDKFFSSKGSLPVIGEVAVKFRVGNEKKQGDRAFNFADKYGDLQAYWLVYLSQAREDFDMFQYSVTTLGYWYFEARPEFWKHHFQTEAQYYNTMAQVILRTT
ncbi:hypothetical protein PCASD_10823 [Puccinia coronata f. sp. avenae]|uniref:Uncharacterized protein n=1 Tax=Puccinia coronata f. sp. avenae TaxID=200324 RepID=A0A2N5TAG8_9BASI|nr:hypothetical protein PCASD_10823 [Puccinia coronata f. sp. avenae]